MKTIKSLKGFVMSMIEALIEARKARAEAITRRIGR
jgi:hypothetical protein